MMLIDHHRSVPATDQVLSSISDPQPTFESLNYTLSVDENGPALQLILNLSARAESKGKTHADMLVEIISGLVHQLLFTVN